MRTPVARAQGFILLAAAITSFAAAVGVLFTAPDRYDWVALALVMTGASLSIAASLSSTFVVRRHAPEVHERMADGPYRHGEAAPPPSVRSRPFNRARMVLLALAAGFVALSALSMGSVEVEAIATTRALWIASGAVALMALVLGRRAD